MIFYQTSRPQPEGLNFHNRRSPTYRQEHPRQTLPERQCFHNRRSATCGTEYTSTLCLKGRTKTLYAYIMGSKWLSKNTNFPDFEGWAVGFAGFTYNLFDKQTIVNYIKNQKEHHKTVNFETEYRQFLTDNGIEIDEKYFLKE
ncbi:MAG: hypothetical protein LBQ28_06295 [Prevotellaceae bacterium]|jgi:hypothetical protein|nr:hypothetical protein [Prevotellaceae bacterium]